MRIAIFELFIIVESLKAKGVIKIDIGKPIPSQSPTPMFFFHIKSVGNAQSLKPTPINEKSHIPSGLLITSSAIIPMSFESHYSHYQLLCSIIHILAIALSWMEITLNNGDELEELLCDLLMSDYKQEVSEQLEEPITSKRVMKI